MQSNTVLTHEGTFESTKEKINAVHAIVPNRSNNKIIVALQHFNNCVDETVQAFMEGNASDVLKEQIVAGKQKKKKKKSKAKSAPEANNSAPDSSKSVSIKKEPPTSTEESGINGYRVNGAINDV